MSRRLHHTPLPETAQELVLSDSATRHAQVLRLRPGQSLVLFDGRGREADAQILELGPPLRCVVQSAREVPSLRPRVVLCQCVPKGGKLDRLVRATTEIGVTSIHLALSERCVARPSATAFEKLARLDRVAREAARQSGRATVPDVVGPARLEHVAARAPETARRLVAAPGGGPITGEADEAWIVVGPEGGLTEAELTSLERLGYERVSLGPTVLRTETAAIVGCALVSAAFRDRGG